MTGADKVNETLDTIHRRRSVRQFADRPVDDGLIRTVLDAANQAPSAHNQQSWRFIIIRGGKKEERSAFADALDSRCIILPAENGRAGHQDIGPRSDDGRCGFSINAAIDLDPDGQVS